MTASLARIVAALAVAAGAAVLVAPLPLAVAGGLLLGFVLPGLALLGVLFRRRVLTPVERAVLTPALSMGVLIVAGLVVHAVGLRIDRLAWTVATVGVTLVAVAAAARLNRPARVTAGVSAEPTPSTKIKTDPGLGILGTGEETMRIDLAKDTRPVGGETVRIPVSGGPPDDHTIVMSIVPVATAAQDQGRHRRLLRQFLPLVVVAAVLGGASWISFATSRDTHNTTVTALSAEPSGPVGTNGNRTVRVSASGLLAADGPYTVRVTAPAGTTTLERTVAVTGDGTWTAALSLPGAQRLTVNLYRSGDATAYRTLFISAVD